ncbi:hypothetical protein IGI04_023832 [Brassica rapa subsp. trilocularis]|uniref:Uncharacterized protein n=1 Tax=Brassica rapa subsp. trilocularis TaxID=1813537 RepID=A0ABQ7M8F9_BRACM|nr:hypothetical protein IGI04_023832 [Brassica rapa subsp. trilocularis]
MVGLTTLGSGGSFITVFAGLWSPGRDCSHNIILRRLLTVFFRLVSICVSGNWFSDRLKTIDDFFLKKRRSVTLYSDLNFREGRFDWSAFHRFGFVVDGAPSCLFAGTGGR